MVGLRLRGDQKYTTSFSLLLGARWIFLCSYAELGRPDRFVGDSMISHEGGGGLSGESTKPPWPKTERVQLANCRMQLWSCAVV